MPEPGADPLAISGVPSASGRDRAVPNGHSRMTGGPVEGEEESTRRRHRSRASRQAFRHFGRTRLTLVHRMNGSGDRRSAPAPLLFMPHCAGVGLASALSTSPKLCVTGCFDSAAPATAASIDEFFSSTVKIDMDDFSTISDHGMLLQGHGMFSAEGCLLTRSSSGVVLTGGKTVPTLKDDRNNKGQDMIFSDWPELVSFDNLEESLRNFDPTIEIGSNYFEDILWSSNCSPEAELVRNSYSDDIDFSIDRNDSNTLKVNTTKTKQQSSITGASSSGTASNYDAHGSSSSGVSDAELFLPFDDTALASQTGRGWEGLEAMLCSSPETRVVPAASSTMCTDGSGSSTCCSSGPDTVTAAHVVIPRSATKTKDPFNGAPDTILEEMAENPLDMYFPPLATYEQPEMLMSDTTSSAPKHRFPEEFAGSCALECAELQFCSEDMSSVGLHGQSGTAVVLDAVPVKDLSFKKLQNGMNKLDVATKGRIRDSLYRLANRLEKRHCVGSTSGGSGSSGSNRFESGGWAETQTNPMDQTVAQLLLQKQPSYRYRKTVPRHRVT